MNDNVKRRRLSEACLLGGDLLSGGLTPTLLRHAVEDTYAILDSLDRPLIEHYDQRMADIVELANLSSMLGNIIALTLVQHCNGAFERAGPHKYQDLRAAVPGAEDVEIKVALETNRPKGHLPKSGHYLTVRYVLGDAAGNYDRKNRGNVIWIWEVRFGDLSTSDFDVSNTAGDSGKTAVVSTSALAEKLRLIYFDEPFCPFASVKRYLNRYG